MSFYDYRVACPFHGAGARPAMPAENAGHRGEGEHGGRIQSWWQRWRVQSWCSTLHLYPRGQQVGVRWRIPAEEQALQGEEDTRGAVYGGGWLLSESTVGRKENALCLCR